MRDSTAKFHIGEADRAQFCIDEELSEAYGNFVLFQDMLDEEALEHDDIRWYRAEQLTDELVTLSSQREEIIRRIWSGELERTLRSLADSFVRDVQDGYDRGLLDHSDLLRIISEIAESKKRRNRMTPGY